MKKGWLTLVAAALVLLLAACSSGDETSRLAKVIGVDIAGQAVAQSWDTHGGFHGDGMTYIQVDFSAAGAESFLAELRRREHWAPLPLSGDLKTVVYGKTEEGAAYGPLLTGQDGKALFPSIENGWYFFLDRHAQSEKPRDATALLSRASFNFTLALFDADGGTLYYCEYDT